MSSFLPADILLPQNIDLQKWSVIACDQYTSDKQYWEAVYEYVQDAPSALKIILPEIFLNQSDVAQQIKKINKTMGTYIREDLFQTYQQAFIYVTRRLSDGNIRKGIVGMLDLEDYAFYKGAQTPVRATEGTVLDRIPPRVKIREDAPLELPHIMILIDDPDMEVIEPIENRLQNFHILYDFNLMQKGGHITGRLLDETENNRIINALDRLSAPHNLNKKYGNTTQLPFTFAVGDGNHSLATAKTCYENLKKTLSAEQLKNHPARYALVELVNLHDKSLHFEAIHRAVFHINPQDMLLSLKNYYKEIQISEIKTDVPEGAHTFTILINGQTLFASVKNPKCNLSVGTLQEFIDIYIAKNGGIVDYIHGDYVVAKLVAESPEDTIGFILPDMKKDDLFKTVILDGALPRKTFSMGRAEDKRFYLESRKIQ